MLSEPMALVRNQSCLGWSGTASSSNNSNNDGIVGADHMNPTPRRRRRTASKRAWRHLVSNSIRTRARHKSYNSHWGRSNGHPASKKEAPPCLGESAQRNPSKTAGPFLCMLEKCDGSRGAMFANAFVDLEAINRAQWQCRCLDSMLMFV